MHVTPRRRGQTLLTLVLLIGGILVTVAAVLIVLVIALTSAGYGFRAGQSAMALAMGGIEDAMVQLVRNGQFASAGYVVTTSAGSATVTVTQNSPSAGYITVLSIASVSNVTRKLNALFAENASTTQVNLISVTQVP